MLKIQGLHSAGRCPAVLALRMVFKMVNKLRIPAVKVTLRVCGFAGLSQPLIERLDHRITAAGGDRCHVYNHPASPQDAAVPVALAGTVVERADPG